VVLLRSALDNRVHQRTLAPPPSREPNMRALFLFALLPLAACATPYDRAEGQRACDQGHFLRNASPAAYLSCLDRVDAIAAADEQERREDQALWLSFFGLD